MRKCTYCGKEYGDDVTRCAIDQQPLEQNGVPIAQANDEPAEPATPLTEVEALRDVANKNMLFGGLWCGGGILVTALTYTAASGSGGSYVIAWGAIIFGGIQFFRGLHLKNQL